MFFFTSPVWKHRNISLNWAFSNFQWFPHSSIILIFSKIDSASRRMKKLDLWGPPPKKKQLFKPSETYESFRPFLRGPMSITLTPFSKASASGVYPFFRWWEGTPIYFGIPSWKLTAGTQSHGGGWFRWLNPFQSGDFQVPCWISGVYILGTLSGILLLDAGDYQM